VSRQLSILKWFLIGWGAVSFLLVAAFIVLTAYDMFIDSRTTKDTASIRDVRFFVGGNLAHAQVEKIVHSYRSDRSFTGDHLDAYAVKMSNLSADQLTASTPSSSEHWYRGDEPLPKVLDDAVSFVEAGHSEVPWFPMEPEVRSKTFYICPVEIYSYGLKLISAGLILVRPADGMAFYIELKV